MAHPAPELAPQVRVIELSADVELGDHHPGAGGQRPCAVDGDAAVEAARERFRPILMTSFAFILGVSPLVIASGAGAGSRHSLGTGVFAGMLFATTIGIFFIPLFFRVIRGLAEGGLSRRAVGAGEPVPVPSSHEGR